MTIKIHCVHLLDDKFLSVYVLDKHYIEFVYMEKVCDDGVEIEYDGWESAGPTGIKYSKKSKKFLYNTSKSRNPDWWEGIEAWPEWGALYAHQQAGVLEDGPIIGYSSDDIKELVKDDEGCNRLLTLFEQVCK